MKVQTTIVSCKRLQERMQCSARTDAVQCGDGCSAVRGRMQCTASELVLTDTGTAVTILIREKG